MASATLSAAAPTSAPLALSPARRLLFGLRGRVPARALLTRRFDLALALTRLILPGLISTPTLLSTFAAAAGALPITPATIAAALAAAPSATAATGTCGAAAAASAAGDHRHDHNQNHDAHDDRDDGSGGHGL